MPPYAFVPNTGHGSSALRTGESIPHGPFFRPGLFGRMFQRPAMTARDEQLITLGRAMTESEAEAASASHDSTIPAGLTYLGQFIDHDITFDPTTLPEARIDPQGLHNFRTPKLDLDSLYGLGPVVQPYLYQRSSPTRAPQFVLGTNKASKDAAGKAIPELPNDLPRNPEGFALVGDPRNDENLIVAQLHVAMLKFHNRVASDNPDWSFDEVRQTVTWHYQFIVLDEFLPAVIDPDELDKVRRHGRSYYTFELEPFMPVEFSAAAYRLHTLVRESYDYNRVFGPGNGRLADASLARLFQFTGLRGTGQFVPVPSNWVIDWRRFFAFPNSPLQTNFARRMDTLLTPTLGGDNSLAVKNLLRGNRMGLPSGQDVATSIGLSDEALLQDELLSGPCGEAVSAGGFGTATPLWFYLMREAELRAKGERLGPVGSRLLAEVFMGLLEGDAKSFIRVQPNWQPTLPAATPGKFKMSDLLSYVNDINPIGD